MKSEKQLRGKLNEIESAIEKYSSEIEKKKNEIKNLEKEKKKILKELEKIWQKRAKKAQEKFDNWVRKFLNEFVKEKLGKDSSFLFEIFFEWEDVQDLLEEIKEEIYKHAKIGKVDMKEVLEDALENKWTGINDLIEDLKEYKVSAEALIRLLELIREKKVFEEMKNG